MGRPKEHDERIAARLLDAAEALVDSGGLTSLSIRAVAEQSSTTTRAVYSLFGSKAGLIAGLGARAFDLLGAAVGALPSTHDPAADLVQAGVGVFRDLAIHRPALFRIGIQQTSINLATSRRFMPAAAAALAILETRFQRLAELGGLPERSTGEAALQFHALCEGLAAMELRHNMRPEAADRIWRDALATLIRGMSCVVLVQSKSLSDPRSTSGA